MRLHPDEGEVVELWEALVADAAELIPGERRESVLCRGPIDCLRTEVPSHEEICYLHGEKNNKTKHMNRGEIEEEAKRYGWYDDGTLPCCRSNLMVKPLLLSGLHGNRWTCKGPPSSTDPSCSL